MVTVAAAGTGVGLGVDVLSPWSASWRVWLLERLQAVDVGGWLGLLVVETVCALVTVDANVESSAMEELDQLVEREGGQGRLEISAVQMSAKPGELLLRS